jgi:uncharacterized membrane protein
MRYDKVSAIAAIVAIAVTASLYGRLPASIPIHWGLTGKPDRWGPAYTIFLLPALALVANFVTMGKEDMEERAKVLRVRLTTAVILVAEAFAIWWGLTKPPVP